MSFHPGDRAYGRANAARPMSIREIGSLVESGQICAKLPDALSSSRAHNGTNHGRPSRVPGRRAFASLAWQDRTL